MRRKLGELCLFGWEQPSRALLSNKNGVSVVLLNFGKLGKGWHNQELEVKLSASRLWKISSA